MPKKAEIISHVKSKYPLFISEVQERGTVSSLHSLQRIPMQRPFRDIFFSYLGKE